MSTRNALVLVCALVVPGCFSPFSGCEHEERPDGATSYVPPDLAGGQLGDRCGDGQPCYQGSCCDGTCVDVYRDPQNCGACGIACPSGECVGGDGLPFCRCDTDGGAPGCGSALEPTCDVNGKCTCNGNETGVCAPPWASSCGPEGCQCGSQPACQPGVSDHCEPNAQGDACRCGSGPSCDPTTSDRCSPGSSPSCRCGDGPACQKGSESCCDIAHRCCPDNMYCCLDGCCDHPCLVFGFCAK
jgi:hypothetical protein